MRFDDDAAPGEGAAGAAAPVAGQTAATAAALAPVVDRRRRNALFSAAVAREVCRRLEAGQTQKEISADPAMPCTSTIWHWVRKHARFAKAYARSRAIGAAVDRGWSFGFSQAAANEIVARVSEGEMLTLICADPHLPSLRTVVRWREDHPRFAEDLRQARVGLAERLSDLGWKMAMEATPETAYLTRVRLGQLRWTAAVMGPRTHGRLKPVATPEPLEIHTYLFRHFKIEEHPETGQHRVVTYTPDPDTQLPVRTEVGPWQTPVDPVKKAAEVGALSKGPGGAAFPSPSGEGQTAKRSG
jgi:hypothetical protein